jgi:hypothetical protein
MYDAQLRSKLCGGSNEIKGRNYVGNEEISEAWARIQIPESSS